MALYTEEDIRQIYQYFLKQDKEKLAMVCASSMLDLAEFLNMDQLSPDETQELLLRVADNVRGLGFAVVRGTEMDVALEKRDSCDKCDDSCKA